MHSLVLISTYGWLPKMFFASQKSHTDEIKAPGDDKSADIDMGKDEPSESDDLTGYCIFVLFSIKSTEACSCHFAI